MKVSVLTVCRNAEGTIARTITFFLEQDCPAKEMALVDGVSLDRRLAIAESFRAPEIRITSEPDRCMYDTLNESLRLYQGNAVGVLSANYLYHDRGILSRVAEALHSHDATQGDLNFHDASGQVVRRWRGTPRPRRRFAAGWMPAHPTFYVRQELAERVDAFDLSRATAADDDWMLHAVNMHGANIACILQVMLDIAMGDRSTASLSAHVRHNLEALVARRSWMNSGLVDWALIAKPASKVTQFAGLRRGTR